jgi:formate dehydrogenase major subunit
VGSGNGRLERLALANLDWLVVRDLVETETASFWYDSPEVETGNSSQKT